MNKLFLLLFTLSTQILLAQNKKGQNEIAIPLHPWLAISQSYYIDFEHFKSPKKSTTFRAGYQGDNFMVSYLTKISTKGIRADIGQRWYLKGETSKVIRFYAGINATVEHTRLQLSQGFQIPLDSLQTKGFSFAPEVNAGLKIVILKHLTISPSLGFRYYFNTMNTNKLTNNQQYWAYNDWDNNSPTWQENRKTVELQHFRKGFLPVPYLNFGWVF